MHEYLFLMSWFVIRLVGAYLTLCPEFCFVVEDNGNVIGYALAALNAKEFYQKMQVAWIPEMCSKYPLLDGSVEEMQSVLQVRLKLFNLFSQFFNFDLKEIVVMFI